MNRQLFVNLSVKDLQKTKAFFEALGFGFNPQFTNETAACMIVSELCSVMLLPEPFFQTFTQRSICNTATHTETLLAVSCESREAVDEMVDRAVFHGGSVAGEAKDHGWMYYRSFYDLNGHHWEPMWADPSKTQQP